MKQLHSWLNQVQITHPKLGSSNLSQIQIRNQYASDITYNQYTPKSKSNGTEEYYLIRMKRAHNLPGNIYILEFECNKTVSFMCVFNGFVKQHEQWLHDGKKELPRQQPEIVINLKKKKISLVCICRISGKHCQISHETWHKQDSFSPEKIFLQKTQTIISRSSLPNYS